MLHARTAGICIIGSFHLSRCSLACVSGIGGIDCAGRHRASTAVPESQGPPRLPTMGGLDGSEAICCLIGARKQDFVMASAPNWGDLLSPAQHSCRTPSCGWAGDLGKQRCLNNDEVSGLSGTPLASSSCRETHRPPTHQRPRN